MCAWWRSAKDGKLLEKLEDQQCALNKKRQQCKNWRIFSEFSRDSFLINVSIENKRYHKRLFYYSIISFSSLPLVKLFPFLWFITFCTDINNFLCTFVNVVRQFVDIKGRYSEVVLHKTAGTFSFSELAGNQFCFEPQNLKLSSNSEV